ncbi:phosphotransferase [Candidatus Woesearchaeota archaeon]|nr:phosphotransferase [Candidatus Woesearchaeota archaeon]
MKMKVSRKAIENIIKQHIPEQELAEVKPYDKGHINEMLEIRLKKSRKPLILRIYNEPWKAKKESFVYRCIKSQLDIPVPEILASDDSGEIIPKAYMLMSKIDGMAIDKNYRKYRKKPIFRKAGEILARLHSVKFHHFGWLMDNEIKPAFRKWRDFAWHDLLTKMYNISSLKEIRKMIPRIEEKIGEYSFLLDIKETPCLLHKDYHCPHILTKKSRIAGIIDVEWAIAGHNENDFIKMELWAFSRMKNLRKPFFDGYRKYGHISREYEQRIKMYELWHWISMVNISKETKNREWLEHNIRALRKFLK